jgi:hypothetical protein
MEHISFWSMLMMLIYRRKNTAGASDGSKEAGLEVNARENQVYVDVSLPECRIIS